MSHSFPLRGVVYIGVVVLVAAALISVQSQPGLAVQTVLVAADVSIMTDDDRSLASSSPRNSW